VLYLFSEPDSNARALIFQRLPSVIDKLGVHGAHPTLLVEVVWALPCKADPPAVPAIGSLASIFSLF
jgi:hypothetical protein